MKAKLKINILNGSPRKNGSNSKLLNQYFTTGFETVRRDKIGQYFLKGLPLEDQQKLFLESDYLIMIFPLYTDAMPGIVKDFIENLASLKGKNPDLNLGFIVHSGFPEGHHSSYLARYLEKLGQRLGCNYMGTVIKGGTEGIKLMPDWMKKKLIRNFTELGRQFALKLQFDPEIVDELRNPYHLSKSRIISFKIMMKLGLGDWYWNSELKKNNAFEKRYAQPYLN